MSSSYTIIFEVRLLADCMPKLIGALRTKARNGGDKATHLAPSLPDTFLDGLKHSHITAGLAFMSNLSRPLVPLSQPTCTRLRSSQILTTLAQIISELVQNSLDAGAKHVDVGLDAEGWECWARDDGCGISSEDLGKLEGRYSESLKRMHSMI